jgi:hypothetical protein
MIFIKCLSQIVQVFKNHPFNSPKVVAAHSAVAGKPNYRVQPEFTLAIGRPHTNVRWLVPLIRIQVKPE